MQVVYKLIMQVWFCASSQFANWKYLYEKQHPKNKFHLTWARLFLARIYSDAYLHNNEVLS